jgi:hypothetical protein
MRESETVARVHKQAEEKQYRLATEKDHLIGKGVSPEWRLVNTQNF